MKDCRAYEILEHTPYNLIPEEDEKMHELIAKYPKGTLPLIAI